MAGNEDLVKSLNHAHHEINELKSQLDTCLGNQSDFERRLSAIERPLEDHILSLDKATRKKNLIVSGLAEDQSETNESLPLTIFNFLQPYVKTLDLTDIDCVYRLGRLNNRAGNRSRPVQCKFTKEQTRNDVAAIRSSLSDEDRPSKVYLNDDLPQAVNERRAKF